ncbi:scavenger receptor class B member, putative [Pediculus humanus corporis]|uniref:Scavenger receptor class B member, putative n=1 Tax=Pediculus humanus subsp. corporis TaxID=121224 RepID=E0W152_PEDHC|nr:scavenger receptor class B member, putative [Pediculus humanus corporis]EEB19358.1 scavenger receptor class B member, putative [Pediculus humanus corporis]
MLPGLPPYDWWKDPPDEVLLKVYVFNVTNSNEYSEGRDDYLRVEEIGPFVFREKLKHTNVTFNNNDTMTYTAHRSAIFLPELSGNLSLDVKLIVPNLPLLGGASFLSKYSFLTKLGFNLILRRLNTNPFIEINANDYMWNWTDPLVDVAKNLMPHLVPVSNVGILDTIYSNFVDDVTVYIGPGNDRKFFKIDKYHGSNRLGYWPDERCDSPVNSSEGIAYHQFVNRNDTIKYLRKTICRVASLYYKKDVVQESMTAYRFDLPKDIFHRPNNSKDDCFTLPGDDPLPSGVADISPCYYNFPFGISLPHFYGATDDLMKYLKVKGMKADEKKHGSYVIIEPTTGIPMESRARSQCNLIVKSMSGYPDFLQKFSHTIIPMFWLEYVSSENSIKKIFFLFIFKGQVGLPWYLSSLMYAIVIVLPSTQSYVSFVVLILGFGFLYYGYSHHFLYLYRNLVFKYHEFKKSYFGYFK